MSPVDTDETTQRIRAAALRLFAERGFGNTTIEHISTEADVGVATIYRRWPDKAAIANELFEQGVASMATILAEPSPGDPKDQFAEVWDRAWSWATSNSDMLVFVNSAPGSPWLSEANVSMKANVSESEIAMYRQLELDADPDFIAALIGSSLAAALAVGQSIDPAEVGRRLWRALNLNAD